MQNSIYSYEDWARDKDLRVKVGQIIEPTIYYQLRSSLPPIQDGYIFQCGEPYSHDWNTGKALYMTFRKKGDYYYYEYIGLFPANYRPN